MNWLKKQFTQLNLLIFLVIALFGYNIFLQTRIEKAIRLASSAEYEAEQASKYAKEAAEYAQDASDNAQEASYNSFGRQCSICPEDRY